MGCHFFGLGNGAKIRIQEKPKADYLKLIHSNSDHATGKRITAESFAHQGEATNQIDSLVIAINLCGASTESPAKLLVK